MTVAVVAGVVLTSRRPRGNEAFENLAVREVSRKYVEVAIDPCVPLAVSNIRVLRWPGVAGTPGVDPDTIWSRSYQPPVLRSLFSSKEGGEVEYAVTALGNGRTLTVVVDYESTSAPVALRRKSALTMLAPVNSLREGKSVIRGIEKSKAAFDEFATRQCRNH